MISKFKLSACMALFLCLGTGQPSQGQNRKEAAQIVDFVTREADRQVDVTVDGKLFTSFCWYGNVFKPVLYPVLTAKGTEVTRGFPLKTRAGERTDHPHQIGVWLTYGNVNGNDFWGNGSQGLGKKNANGGSIKHLKVEKVQGGNGEGILVSTESWTDSTGRELLSESAEYHFIARGATRMVDRITTLKATGGDVTFADTKEGMFGMRVARQLELPAKGDVTLTDAQGNPTVVKALAGPAVYGNYKSSEGIEGENVWSTRAKWMNLYGNIDTEKITLVIFDHPSNPYYPTFWHSRGYGLFAANPLGAKDFTKGKETLNFSLPAGKSVTFRFRLLVQSGSHLTDAEINSSAAEFAKRY